MAMYQVRFVDWDGTILSNIPAIEEGTAATPPSNPTREFYTFQSWDKDFSNITEDTVVTALYKPTQYDVRMVRIRYGHNDTYYMWTNKHYSNGKAQSEVPHMDHWGNLPPEEAGKTGGPYVEGGLKILRTRKSKEFESDIDFSADYNTGHTFDKWSIQCNGHTYIVEDDGVVCNNGEDFVCEDFTITADRVLKDICGNVVMTALYKVNKYKVKFKYYNSAGEYQEREVERDYGTPIQDIIDELDLDYKNRPGYTFQCIDPNYDIVQGFDFDIEFFYTNNFISGLKEYFDNTNLPNCPYYTSLKKITNDTLEYDSIVLSDCIRFDRIYKYCDIAGFAENGKYTDLNSAIDRFYNLDYEQLQLPAYTNISYADYIARYDNAKVAQDVRFDKSCTEILIETTDEQKTFKIDKMFLVDGCEKCTVDWGDGTVEQYEPSQSVKLYRSTLTVEDNGVDVLLPESKFERYAGQKVIFYRTGKYRFETEY